MNDSLPSESVDEPKTWSLEEANEAIPLMTKAFDGIFELTSSAESLNKDISILHEIWGAGLLEPGNPDHGYYRELRQRKAEIQGRLDLAISELHRLGCSIDDFKRGIVHFYHKTPRGLAVFCWRYGEQKINHWHELTWKAERKPIGLTEKLQ